MIMFCKIITNLFKAFQQPSQADALIYFEAAYDLSRKAKPAPMPALAMGTDGKVKRRLVEKSTEPPQQIRMLSKENAAAVIENPDYKTVYRSKQPLNLQHLTPSFFKGNHQTDNPPLDEKE